MQCVDADNSITDHHTCCGPYGMDILAAETIMWMTCRSICVLSLSLDVHHHTTSKRNDTWFVSDRQYIQPICGRIQMRAYGPEMTTSCLLGICEPLMLLWHMRLCIIRYIYDHINILALCHIMFKFSKLRANMGIVHAQAMCNIDHIWTIPHHHICATQANTLSVRCVEMKK